MPKRREIDRVNDMNAASDETTSEEVMMLQRNRKRRRDEEGDLRANHENGGTHLAHRRDAQSRSRLSEGKWDFVVTQQTSRSHA